MFDQLSFTPAKHKIYKHASEKHRRAVLEKHDDESVQENILRPSTPTQPSINLSIKLLKVHLCITLYPYKY